jgi:queuine tRNA-ribosyltransferase
VDMFDSVFPTRIARHGVALTWNGRINLRAAKYRYDMRPIDEGCSCYTCKTFTRSYIHHLLSRKEVLGQILLTIHNIRFMIDFMGRVRESIENGEFEKFKREFLESYGGGKR